MRRSMLRLVPLALALALMHRCVLRAEVIISEIMYNADGADQPTATTNREWAELYNTGSSAVNIGGWQFGDANDNQWASVFPAGTTIQPHQALVVTGDAATFDSQWGTGINRVQVTSFPPLANRTSTVGNVERPAIRNGSQIIDAVQYAENFASPVDPWPMIDDTSNGHSIFVVPQGLSAAANDHGVYWKPSARDVYGGNYRNSGGEN